MKNRYWLTITDEMVRNQAKLKWTEYRPLFDCMGRLLPRDVGKKAYVSDDGIVQVENDEQLAMRMTEKL